MCSRGSLGIYLQDLHVPFMPIPRVLLSQHVLLAFLVRSSFLAAGAVFGQDGLSAACGPSQLMHLDGFSEGCSVVLWGGRIPLAPGYSTFSRVP